MMESETRFGPRGPVCSPGRSSHMGRLVSTLVTLGLILMTLCTPIQAQSNVSTVDSSKSEIATTRPTGIATTSITSRSTTTPRPSNTKMTTIPPPTTAQTSTEAVQSTARTTTTIATSTITITTMELTSAETETTIGVSVATTTASPRPTPSTAISTAGVMTTQIPTTITPSIEPDATTDTTSTEPIGFSQKDASSSQSQADTTATTTRGTTTRATSMRISLPTTDQQTTVSSNPLTTTTSKKTPPFVEDSSKTMSVGLLLGLPVLIIILFVVAIGFVVARRRHKRCEFTSGRDTSWAGNVPVQDLDGPGTDSGVGTGERQPPKRISLHSFSTFLRPKGKSVFRSSEEDLSLVNLAVTSPTNDWPDEALMEPSSPEHIDSFPPPPSPSHDVIIESSEV
uniref:uncharacterized protein n=1 Tax=Myxine glutinosa TaxID=7769 RepID=UPI00358FCB8A